MLVFVFRFVCVVGIGSFLNNKNCWVHRKYISPATGFVILKMALTLKRHEWFIGLWENSRAFTFPVTFSNA
jgi:hypothetical protein